MIAWSAANIVDCRSKGKHFHEEVLFTVFKVSKQSICRQSIWIYE